jgi:acylphosphatase
MSASPADNLHSIRHLRITGLVQGVGYRVAFEREARAMHLAGWVRNRLDGSVEAVVAGDAASLERIIAWARRGPAAARVDQVVVTDADETQVGEEFNRLPTA